MTMKKITVVMPAYNEEKTVASALRALIAVDFAAAGFEREIIVVDDGSTDGTAAAVVGAAGRCPGVKIIGHKKNLGKGAALRTAFASARGDIVAVHDADLEYDPSAIPRLAAFIADGRARVVYGSRFLSKNPVIYRRYYAGNRIISGIIGALFFRRITDAYTCHKVFDKSVLDMLKLSAAGFEIEAEITSKILRLGLKISEAPIKYNPRTIKEGKKISFRDALRGVFTAVKLRFVRRSTFLKLKKPLRVCMVTARFHPHVGGAEKQGLLLASRMTASGHKIFVCTQAYERRLARRENIAGVPVSRIASSSSPRFMIEALFFLIFRRSDYDVAHALLASSPSLAAVAAGFAAGKKVVIKLGCSGPIGDIASSRSTFAGRLKLFLIKKSSAVLVCPSREVFDEVAAAGFPPDRAVIIPNGADTAGFATSSAAQKRNSRISLGLPPDGRIALFAGRFERQKGLDGLVSRWGDIVEKDPSAKLLLAGHGSMEKDLRSAAAALGAAASSVVFVPPAADVEKYYAAADVFVLPTSAEGLSNSMLEAMSCGLTAVVTDIKANAFVIEPGVNGYLAPPDPEGFARKLGEIMTLPDETLAKIGAAARRTVEQKYSADIMVESYIELYGKL